MSSSLDLSWSTPNGIHSLKHILHSLIPQWPNGPHPYQLKATVRILDHHKQLVIAACGEGKMALSYLHILIIQELQQRLDLPQYGLNVPSDWKPVVLMVMPLTDLGRSQVRY